jgi:hypothetical protein
MLTAFRRRVLAPRQGVRYKATTIPTATRLSGQPHSTPQGLVLAMKVPDVYDKKTFDPQDPASAQLLVDNNARVVQDTTNFTGRVLTRVTGTLRRHKRQHLFEQAALRHILERHSPRHFAGKFKSKENFFPQDITIAQISALILLVYRNGRRMQRRPPKPGQVVDKTFFQMTGRVNGVAYVLGLHGGKVVQFYPKKDSVAVPGPTGEQLAPLRAAWKPVVVAEPEKE